MWKAELRERLTFCILSLCLATLPVFGDTAAQTISADSVELIDGEDNWATISWSYPKTAERSLDDMSWALCFKAVTSRQRNNLETADFDGSCVKTNYWDAESGQGEYDALIALPLGAEHQSYVAAVVNKSDGYARPYAHVIITVSHPDYPYRSDLISLPEGQLFGSGESIPLEIGDAGPHPYENPTRDADQISIYRRPVENVDGSVSPGRYVGSIKAKPSSTAIDPTTYMWNPRGGGWRQDVLGRYELHYIRDRFVVARAAFENGIPDLKNPLKILNWDAGGFAARLDRREIQRLGSRPGAYLMLFRLNERNRTQIAAKGLSIEQRPRFADDFSAADCDDMPEACFVDETLNYAFEAAEYQVQLVVGGMVIASEKLKVSEHELAARALKVTEMTSFNRPVVEASVGPPTVSGSVISIRAFVPKYQDEEEADWYLTIDNGTERHPDPSDIDRITLWELKPGTPLETEFVLPAGEYIVRVEQVEKTEGDNPERNIPASFAIEVDLVLPKGSVQTELDPSRTFAAGARVTTRIRLSDEIAKRIDGHRVMAVLENTAHTTAACYRGEYSANFRRVSEDLAVDLDYFPWEPGTYALRLYYPAHGQNSRDLRLAGEQLINVALPDAKLKLLSADKMVVGEAPSVLIEGAGQLIGEDPSRYAVYFEGAGYIAPGGGLRYATAGLMRDLTSSIIKYSNFEDVAAPVVGNATTKPGAYIARLYYGSAGNSSGWLTDSVSLVVTDPADPDYPSLSLASIGSAPSHFSPALPAPSLPGSLPVVCPGFETPRIARVEEPDETVPEYKSPPFLGLEAAVYPREPVPGLPVTVGFRIENTSQYPAADIAVNLILADPRTEHAPRQLVPQSDFCEDQGDGQFRCTLGDMDPGENADLLFYAETPMTGAVVWTADLDSAGDLGGAVAHAGVLGARAPPRIMDVVIIADQKRVENEVPSYPYPFGPNNRGKQSRYLLVVGHNLPQRPADNLELTDSETIHYGFLAYPDANSQFYQELIAEGWRRFYDLDDAADAGARAEADGYDAILVRADLKEGILPGQHTVTVSGAEGHWGLEFGDITARLSFVRVLDDGSFDLLTNAYLPERIHLAVQTNMPLPLEEIPVYLSPELLGAGQTAEIALTAQRSDTGDGRLYLTGPLDLYPQGRLASLAGGTAIPARLGEDSLAVLQARVDQDFIFQKFRIPLDPVVASVTFDLTPAAGDYSWLWKDALNRAAACNDNVVVEDWNRLSLAESENIWNLMILTTSDHFPDQSVNFGQHAASILLRDMFLATTEKQLRKLEWIKGNKQAVKGLLAYMKPRATDDGYPLLRMKIIDPDGDEIDFRYAIMNETDWLAEQYGTSEAALEAWQLRVTVTALGKLIEAANEALEDAREAGDCEVEDLVRMTGFSFGSVGWLLKAQMVTLAETNSPSGPLHLWTPDETARFWVDQVAPLAAAVRAQQKKSSEDTDLTLTALAFLTLPFMLSESAVVAIVTFGIDLIDLGVTTVNELSQYFASEAELRFALGASVTIGEERYDEALKNAKGWVSTTFGIGTSALGAIAGGFDALPKLAALRRVARGRQVARTLEGGAAVASLKPVDLQDFGAFAMAAQMRHEVSGVASLSAVERRALDIVDEYSTLHQVRRAMPEPDLPPVSAVDSFEPSAPIRFDPADQSGFATARPPLEGSIATPRSSGDVPNARDARVPENGHVRFMTETDIEELPLGERLGGGYTSEVFAHADDAENLAVRITHLRENAPAAALDQVGDNLLRTRVSSEHIRPVRIERSYDVILGDVGQPEITRVMVVERVPETAQQTIARQGGRMSVAQMMAYEGALRDLNRQGLVWLDNKWDNFGFVPLNDGSGRVQVVVMDTGGIVPIRADAGLAEGLSAADIARQIQLRVNGDFATQIPDYAFIGRQDFRTAVRKDVIRDDFGDMFDYEAMGISGREQLLFNPKSGEDFDYIAPLFEAVE